MAGWTWRNTTEPMIDTLNRGLRRIPVWAVYLVLTLPAVWLVWLLLSGQLGVDPTKVLERELGEFCDLVVIHQGGLGQTGIRELNQE